MKHVHPRCACSWDELKFYGCLARNLFVPGYDLHKVGGVLSFFHWHLDPSGKSSAQRYSQCMATAAPSQHFPQGYFLT